MEGGLTSILNKVIACVIRYGIKNHYNLKCFIHKYTILKDKHKNEKRNNTNSNKYNVVYRNNSVSTHVLMNKSEINWEQTI